MATASPLLALIILLAAGCVAPAAEVDAEDVQEALAFGLEAGECREILAMFPVSLEHARRYVPAGYTPTGDAAGRAIAFSGAKLCDDLLLDGQSVGPASTIDAGVFIEAPDGSDGFHYYQTWWLTDNDALALRLAMMGWNSSLLDSTTLSGPAVADRAGAVTASVPWASGPYALDTEVAGAPAPFDNRAVGWHDGPLGLVRVVKDLPTRDVGLGEASMRGGAGTPMVELVGGDGARGSALWDVYALRAIVEWAPAP